jgi:hypothetical protein
VEPEFFAGRGFAPNIFFVSKKLLWVHNPCEVDVVEASLTFFLKIQDQTYTGISTKHPTVALVGVGGGCKKPVL